MACGTARTCLCGLYIEGKHKGKCRQCFTKPKYLPAQRSFEIEALLRASEAKNRSKCMPGSCSQDDLALTVRRSRSAERCDGSRVKACASPAGEFGTPTMRRIMTKGKVPSSESCSTTLNGGMASAVAAASVAAAAAAAQQQQQMPSPLASSSSLVAHGVPGLPVVNVIQGPSAIPASLSGKGLLRRNGSVNSVTTDPSEHIYETIGSPSPTPSQQSKCAASPPPPYDGSTSSVCTQAAATAAMVGVGTGKGMSVKSLGSGTYSNKSVTKPSGLFKPSPRLRPGVSPSHPAQAKPRLPPSYDELELTGRLDSMSLASPAVSEHGDCSGHSGRVYQQVPHGGTYPKLMSKEDKAELKRLIGEVKAEQERKEIMARLAASRRLTEQAHGCSCPKCQQQLVAEAQYYGPNPPYNENDLSSAVFPMETQVLMQDILTDGMTFCSLM